MSKALECAVIGCGHLRARHDETGKCTFAECECSKFAGYLTAQEWKVLTLLASGASCKEAAIALGLATKTVESHRTNLCAKTETHSTLAVVLAALRGGGLKLEDLPPSRVMIQAQLPS